jgi:hypothetical protein
MPDLDLAAAKRIEELPTPDLECCQCGGAGDVASGDVEASVTQTKKQVVGF